MKIGADAPFFAELRSRGCDKYALPAGAPVSAWSEAIARQAKPFQAYFLGRIPSEHAGQLIDLEVVTRSPDYILWRLLIKSRFSEIQSLAYVLQPQRVAGPRPVAILLHGSGTLPHQAFGLRLNGEGDLVTRPDSSLFIGAGLSLAHAGFTVIAPVLGTRPEYGRVLPWLDLTLWGEIFNVKTAGGGPETLLVAEIRAFIDYAVDTGLGEAGKIYLVGWREGSYLAALTAASDPRVAGLVRLSAPFDRRGYRQSEAGMLHDATFAHADCRLGDVAQTVLLNGKPLMYAGGGDDVHEALRSKYHRAEIDDSLAALYAARRHPEDFRILVQTWDDSRIQDSVAVWLRRKAGLPPRALATWPVRVRNSYQFPQGDLAQRSATTGRFLGSLPSCPSIYDAVATAPPGDPATVTRIRNALDAGTLARGMGYIKSRTVVDSTRGYRLSLIEYGSRTGLTYRGLLAEPPEGTEKAPAVLAFNGTDDLGDLFAVGPPANPGYLHGYGDALARRGFVVLVPIIPTWVPDVATGLTAAQTSGKVSSWRMLVRDYTRALDALLRIGSVDPDKVAAYGISYGGTAASIMAAMDPRIHTLVYSNIPQDYRTSFNSNSGVDLTAWMAAACSVVDAAFLAVAPRPLVWEAGEDALMKNGGMDIVQRVRDRYALVGAQDSMSFRRHGGHHETFPDEIRIFGR